MAKIGFDTAKNEFCKVCWKYGGRNGICQSASMQRILRLAAFHSLTHEIAADLIQHGITREVVALEAELAAAQVLELTNLDRLNI